MSQVNYSIISKGEYDNGKNPPAVYPKQYVFLKNGNKEKYLSLRFYNGLEAAVSYIEFILFQLDSAGNVIKKFRVREEISRSAKGKTFALANGIKLCDKCVDFKIQMVCARCGKYYYSLKHKGASAVYLQENRWRYDPDNQGNFGYHSARSQMQKEYGLVKLLAILALVTVIGMSIYPIIKYAIELLG